MVIVRTWNLIVTTPEGLLRSCPELTECPHGVVDGTGRADPMCIYGSDDKLVLRIGHQTLEHHGVRLYWLSDVRPLSVHLWPATHIHTHHQTVKKHPAFFDRRITVVFCKLLTLKCY